MTKIMTTAACFTCAAGAVFAGSPVPLPLAGAAGPVGLGVAVVGYVAYRVVKARSNR